MFGTKGLDRREKRHLRIRKKIQGTAERPRLVSRAVLERLADQSVRDGPQVRAQGDHELDAPALEHGIPGSRIGRDHVTRGHVRVEALVDGAAQPGVRQ